LVAAARIASPIFVNWKRNQRTATVPSETTIVPMSCSEIVTPATWIVSLGNGLSTALTSPDQIHVIRPFSASNNPIVTITTRNTSPPSTGRMIVWWIATPPANETSNVTTKAGQYGQPWFTVSDQAMYVEKVAISPWAKLITPVARWISTSARASEP
jgi:hypothetical protein